MSKPDEAQVIARLRHIQQLIERKQLEEAAQSLNGLATVLPNDPRLYWLGSLMAEAAGNIDGALQAAHKAYDLHPQWPAGALRVAQVAVIRKDIKTAIEKVAVAVKLATDQKTLNTDLLHQAAAVCLGVQQPTQALEWIDKALTLAPTNLSLRLIKAHAYAYNKEPQKAIDIYDELLALLPGQNNIRYDRGLAYMNLDNKEQARAEFEFLLQADPGNKVYEYYLARAKGETPQTQPATAVTRLFDNYAESFDNHLVLGLKYKLPHDVAGMILGWFPDKSCDVLDLGCGTGLLGACLGPMKGVVVGVDLSMKMIEQAAKHGVYDKFHQVNILNALAATPAHQYDVITSLDVLIYVGDLREVMPNALRILNSKGRFVFSCEKAPESVTDFDLPTQTGRYRHNPQYVRRLLEAAGFKDIQFEDRVLRHETGQPVDGFLVIAQA